MASPDIQAGIDELYALSPFELQDELRRRAGASGAPMLDAGKGQPNWLATTPRLAFHLLGRFAVGEARRHAEHPHAGWRPSTDGVAERLHDFLDKADGGPDVELLRTVVDHGTGELGFVADEWVGELVDGILGDSYPWPHRLLVHVEQVLHEYFVKTHCVDRPPEGRYRLFGTEGGAAAMTYVFQALRRNGVLVAGDKIAIGTPVFSPYLQIPVMSEYGFEIVHVQADEDAGWRYPLGELAQLRDPQVKGFFLVNPGNPGTRALDPDEIAVIANIVAEARPDLIILADTAYATFVDGFRSLAAELPAQTIAVHSFSKQFGATGERLGFIAMHEDHVVDRLLRVQPGDERARRAARYRSVTHDLDGFTFVDRVVAESRDVALYHIAGLSTPQQVQMALFAGFALRESGWSYLGMTRQVLLRRLRALLEPLGIEMPEGVDTHYYTLVDVVDLARRRHGDDFATALVMQQHPLAFPLRLAERYGVVALPGRGFEGPSWSVRVSLANLPDEAYPRIATALGAVVDDMHAAHVEGGAGRQPERHP